MGLKPPSPLCPYNVRDSKVLQAGLHVQVIGPDVDDLQVIEPSPLPGRRLVLPLRLEPLDRGGRQ